MLKGCPQNYLNLLHKNILLHPSASLCVVQLVQTPSLAPRSRGEPLLAEERQGRESGTNTKQRLPTSPRYFRDKNFVTSLALVTPRLPKRKCEGGTVVSGDHLMTWAALWSPAPSCTLFYAHFIKTL